jgi:methionine aminopeptidase
MATKIQKVKKNNYLVNGRTVKIKNNTIHGINQLSFDEEMAVRDFIQKEKLGLKIQSSIY